MNYRPNYSGRIVIPVLFKLCRNMWNRFEILREISIECVSNPELFTLLKATKPYEKPKKVRRDRKLEIVESDLLPEFE